MSPTADEFVRLRASTTPADYLRAANEDATDSVWLEVVQQHPEMRFWVAQSKTVPVSILQLLAADADSKVRSMVAMKNKLTPELFDLLSRDDDPGVRERIARNKRCPVSLLKRLSSDVDELVALAARDRLSQESQI